MADTSVGAGTPFFTFRPPLLLLQGFGANATWQWYGQVGHFAPHRRLMVPDLLHFGGSVPRRSDCTLEAQVELIRELLDHQGVDRCDVVGVSYGGFVALGLSHEHPERVRLAVFVDSPGVGYTERDYQSLLSTFSINHISELLLPAEPDGLKRLLQIAWHRPPWTPSFALPDVHRNLFIDRVAEKRALLDNLLARLRGPPLGLPLALGAAWRAGAIGPPRGRTSAPVVKRSKRE